MCITFPMLSSTIGFVPASLNAADWAQLQPLVAELLARPVNSSAELERWVIDRSDMDAACSEARASLYIACSCDTENAALSDSYTRYLDSTAPRLEVAGFELDKRFVSLVDRFPLPTERYAVLVRSKRAGVELFRESNVPIQTELSKLNQEYAKVSGAQMVEFDGQERTIPQMQVYQLVADRGQRQRAWCAVASRRVQDRERLDELLDAMVERRDRLARNAGLSGYIDYAFRERERFDYTPLQCEQFWSAVEKHVVPMLRRLDDRRARELQVDHLRPWDTQVDLHGRPGLKPFAGGLDLVRKTQRVMDALDPRLGAMTRRLAEGSESPGVSSDNLITPLLDLDSRKGKRPGGYQYVRDHSRRPFIFMNAAGMQRDMVTMLHEAGHAFHSMLCEEDPILEYRHSPVEFAEVASMSMEHLTMPHWGVKGGFYDRSSDDFDRARREHLEHSVTTLAWIATIDAFQHWMYRHPTHTRRERDTYWLGLDARFGHSVCWDGIEEFRACQWQRQSHLFSHPMYYIEYGIAQLGALGLWLKSLRDGQQAAVDAYIRALTLGGSRPLPELFKAADLEFRFDDHAVGRIVDAVESEISKMN